MKKVLLSVALWLVIAASLSAIVVTRVTVGIGPTLIYTAATGGSNVLVRNAGAVSVFLGSASVTPLVGFELLAGDAITLPLGPSDPVYGITATDPAIVHVMESRR